jgi:hypothetical protein
MKRQNHGKLWWKMQNLKLALPLVIVGLALSACQIPPLTASAPIRSLAIPAPEPVDPAVGDPCTEAAMAKYFIGPERVTLLSAGREGASTAVRMKADLRDALCLVSDKGKVISLTDTTPKSANQIAAEEAAALAKANGTAEPVAEPKPVMKKKKLVKKPAVGAKPAAAKPAAAKKS